MRYRQKRGGKGCRHQNDRPERPRGQHPRSARRRRRAHGLDQRQDQQIRADIRPIGRNTQGVQIMTLDEGDLLASLARIPAEVV
ncbi:MAG: DNA gyrase C-terminal beta-propeller domain-containing protein [Planctomycetaceae bacterium]